MGKTCLPQYGAGTGIIRERMVSPQVCGPRSRQSAGGDRIRGLQDYPLDHLARFARSIKEEAIVTWFSAAPYGDSHAESDGSVFQISNILAIDNLRRDSGRPLLEVLDSTSFFVCSDIKDFLYAVLDLAGDVTTARYGLGVDYGQERPGNSDRLIHMVRSREKGPALLPQGVQPHCYHIARLPSEESKFKRWLLGLLSWVLDLTTKTLPCIPIDVSFFSERRQCPTAISSKVIPRSSC